MTPTTITVHSTANPSSTAQSERQWLTNPANKREASFHIVVDEREAIECIPLNEKAIHSGDLIGNMSSLGVEICESGNRQKTLQNAAELLANKLRERGWGIAQLRRHHDWSGKNCPHIFNDDGKWGGWEVFVKMVDKNMNPPEPVDPNAVKVYVDGKKVADGKLMDGKTWVELRAVAEALGANVSWDAKTRSVNLS